MDVFDIEKLIPPGIDEAIKFIPNDDETAALKKLERFETDLVVSVSGEVGRISYSLNQNSEKGRLSERILLDGIGRLHEPRPQLVSRSMSGRPIRYADWVLPGLLAMNIMFGSMFGVGGWESFGFAGRDMAFVFQICCKDCSEISSDIQSR